MPAGKERVGQPRAARKPGFHLGDDLLLIGGIVAVAGQLHQQVEPPRAVFVGRVGQRLNFGRRQALQLQLAGGFGHGKSVACLRVESRRALQNAKLLVRLGVAARVVVGIAQSAQVGRGQQRLGAQLRELGARGLRLGTQRMAQQQQLEGRLRSLLLAQRQLHLPFGKLESRPARGRSAGGRSQHLARRGDISHGQQNGGLQLRLLGVEDAVRIALGKAVQNFFGDRIVTRRVACLGVEKIYVVGQFPIAAPRLRQRRFRIGIALVEQVRVAQRQVGRRRGLAGVAVRVGRHCRVGFRRAQCRQLLGHRLQLF